MMKETGTSTNRLLLTFLLYLAVLALTVFSLTQPIGDFGLFVRIVLVMLVGIRTTAYGFWWWRQRMHAAPAGPSLVEP